jgi:hypothetical protein
MSLCTFNERLTGDHANVGGESGTGRVFFTLLDGFAQRRGTYADPGYPNQIPLRPFLKVCSSVCPGTLLWIVLERRPFWDRFEFVLAMLASRSSSDPDHPSSNVAARRDA